jgi:hypothetical protein
VGLKETGTGELCEWGCIFIEILVHLLTCPSLAEVEEGGELSC